MNNSENFKGGLKPIASVRLEIKGYHIPAFKNSKLLLKKKGLLITNPRYQSIMKQIMRDIESQLSLESRTTAEGILTECSAHCWTALLKSLPQDDSWQWMPEITMKAVKVNKGDEGATLVIEKL